MDTGGKTLAQLSEENKEQKFVTLDIGSKISGYTKDYLERLCRLGKMDYKLRANGSFAIELESLLRETHAILLSYEGITFTDKSELSDHAPQVDEVPLSAALKEVTATTPSFSAESSHAIPTFGEALAKRSAPFSFVGRAVVSDALHPEEKTEKVVSIPVIVPTATPTSTPPPMAPVAAVAASAPSAATHVPIRTFNMDAIRVPAENSTTETPPHAAMHIPIMRDVEEKDQAKKNSANVSDGGEKKQAVVAAGAVVELPHQAKKVIVFSDNGPAVVPAAGSVPPIVPTPPPLVQTPPPPSIAPLTTLSTEPELHVPVQKEQQPIIKANAMTPMNGEEHHLTRYETHPLMKNTGFNAVFAVLFVAASFSMWGMQALRNVSDVLGSQQYVAGVGAAGGMISDKSAEEATTTSTPPPLPFSNDIIATSGPKQDSILIQPVFPDGPGQTYEYIIVPKVDAQGATP